MSKTTSITVSKSNYNYSDSGSIKSGEMRVGDQYDENNQTSAGKYIGYFYLPLYDLENKGDIGKLLQVKLSIPTYNSTSGYNSCYARIDYVGTTIANTSLWRLGSDNDTIHLSEGKTTSLTTTESTTLSNFRDIIKNSVAGTQHWFRLRRTSGIGAIINGNITVTFTYDKGVASYVCVNGSWVETTPYVCVNGAWNECQSYYCKDGVWCPT